VRTAMAEEGRKRIPLVQKAFDEGLDVTPDVVANLVLFLASGKADALSGRLFSVNDNPEEMLRRAQEIKSKEFYLLRAQRL